MTIPTRSECLAILEKERVPAHIVAHSKKVALVGTALAEILNRHGNTLDLELVEAASLLHDITKMSSLASGENHAATGAVLLAGMGFPEVAEIVRQHIILDPRDAGGEIVEVEVVYYADKRVRHDCIVTLPERLADLAARYARTPERARRLAEINKSIELLERRLFSGLPVSPVALCQLEG